MKKYILIVALFAAFNGLVAQTVPVNTLRIQNATTALGMNIPIGTHVYNVATQQTYVATAGVATTETLTTAAASFALVNTVVTDNLTSTSTAEALSANQGKVLQDNKLDNDLTETQLFVGDATDKAAAVALSGDATLANDGTLTIEDDAVDGTDIQLVSESAGDVMYNDGTDWIRLPAGTAGQVLAINAAGTAPEWTTPSSGGGPSKRIGEFIHAKSGRSVADGYLAVTPGTVTNGAVDYPIWAAMYPEFVSGNNIVFPSNVAGMFLRNIGGYAAAEGNYQASENKSHTHNSQDKYISHVDKVHGYDTSGILSISYSAGGSWSLKQRINESGSEGERYWGVDSPRGTSSQGTDESRPANRAYQLYTIVDTY